MHILFGKKLYYFSTNRHINSLSTLCYSLQEPKHCSIKIRPILQNPRYHWSLCYIPINTFSLVKVHFTHHNLYGNGKLSAQNRPYHPLSVCTSLLINSLNQNGTFQKLITFLAKSLGKQDTLDAHLKQLTWQPMQCPSPQVGLYSITLVLHFVPTCRNTYPANLLS